MGHSYGGAVITEAGTDEVAALVYVTAFAPDAGESVATLIADPPPGAPVPPILPPRDGFLLLDREKFAAAFAADVDPELAAFMADAQLPWGVAAVQAAITQPAWKSKPSWYLVARDDRMIPPPAQRAMAGRADATTSESAGSHCVFISHPEAVVQVISPRPVPRIRQSPDAPATAALTPNRRRESRSPGGGSLRPAPTRGSHPPRSRRTVTRAPLIVLPRRASTTSPATSSATSTIENRSAMSIAPISRPVIPASPVMAPTRSCGRTPACRPAPM